MTDSRLKARTWAHSMLRNIQEARTLYGDKAYFGTPEECEEYYELASGLHDALKRELELCTQACEDLYRSKRRKR